MADGSDISCQTFKFRPFHRTFSEQFAVAFHVELHPVGGRHGQEGRAGLKFGDGCGRGETLVPRAAVVAAVATVEA